MMAGCRRVTYLLGPLTMLKLQELIIEQKHIAAILPPKLHIMAKAMVQDGHFHRVTSSVPISLLKRPHVIIPLQCCLAECGISTIPPVTGNSLHTERVCNT